MPDDAILRSHPPFPEKVGKFELLLPIGTGGMATVYLARSTGVGGFERDVALKLVHAHLRTDEDSKLQLLEEAKLAARIRHPNVVPVLEVDEDPLGLFLVMDYVEGDTLSGLARASRASGRPLPFPLIARILNDALLGLHAAHALTDPSGRPLNLVHRDFSPQNILVSVQGITRLADFGVAKAANRAVRTKTGLVKGKISYMSPEQARGQPIDRRCDVWAAGVVAWELIAGRRMHRSDDDVATLLSIVTEDPPRLRSVIPRLPKAIDEAIAWALTPDVSKRCPTAEDLRKALYKAFEETEGVADTVDLARFVQQVVGPKLDDRRASVSEVRTLRRRMVELASARADDASDSDASEMPPKASSTPRAPTGRTPQLASASGAPLDGASAPPDFTDSPHEIATPSRSRGVRAEEHTQTSAVVPLFESVRRDRKRWLIGGIAGAALISALGLAVVEFVAAPEDGSTPATATPDSASLQAAASAAQATNAAELDRGNPDPSDVPRDDVALPRASAAVAETETAPENAPSKASSEPPKAPPIRRRAPTSPAPKESDPAGRTKKPKLADSPYVTPNSDE